MGHMELWRKSNRGWGIKFGLERGWCCLRRVCGIIMKVEVVVSGGESNVRN